MHIFTIVGGNEGTWRAEPLESPWAGAGHVLLSCTWPAPVSPNKPGTLVFQTRAIWPSRNLANGSGLIDFGLLTSWSRASEIVHPFFWGDKMWQGKQ